MKTVFLDVDTQIDFMYPAGALYVPGAEDILPAISRLNAYATGHGHPLLSTADAHTEDDPEFRSWPAHCVLGTVGQEKPGSTFVGQTMVSKRTTDCFFQTKLSELLQEIGAERFVLYGVVTEICVRYAGVGLLPRGRRVEIVTDAVKSLNVLAAEAFLREFTSAGGFLTTSAEITGR